LCGQLREHLHDFFGGVVMGQTDERLKQYGEAVELVPKNKHHAELFNVVTCWVPFEEVCLAACLLLNVELNFFAHTVCNKRLHEIFWVDREQNLGWKLEYMEDTTIQFFVPCLLKWSAFV
jgi:hypothetical protein